MTARLSSRNQFARSSAMDILRPAHRPGVGVNENHNTTDLTRHQSFITGLPGVDPENGHGPLFNSRASVANFGEVLPEGEELGISDADNGTETCTDWYWNRDCGHNCALALMKWLQDGTQSSYYFFIGNTIRTYGTCLLVLGSLALTIFCTIQYWVETNRTLHRISITEYSKCSESREDLAPWWIVYVGVYYGFVLLVAPFIVVYYDSGDRPLFAPRGKRTPGTRPLFIATRSVGRPTKNSPATPGGSYELIHVAMQHLKRFDEESKRRHKRPAGLPDGCPWPRLELPTEVRKQLKLSRAQANALLVFASMRRCKSDGRLFATIRLSPKEEADPKAERLVPVHRNSIPGSDELSTELTLDGNDSLIALVSGFGSIRSFEWLIFISWLATVAAIFLDSNAASKQTGVNDEQWWNQLVEEHVWLTWLFAFYLVVLVIYPIIKFAQELGLLTFLEPLAVFSRKIRSVCRPPTMAPAVGRSDNGGGAVDSSQLRTSAPNLGATLDAELARGDNQLDLVEPQARFSPLDDVSDESDDSSTMIGGSE